ncbi:hypothetical protein [Methylobacter sp. YRD-M1]|uniref:hypothetical protein n=1 Tax=Methylobacter sp. YRD-M1 TaxID=2911520 RepID=UPI00227C6548|nr:hypothetical protein [Methylobacter sp. YRD-M1]WAK02062.1 hypothetical protein LZ558_19975 [Methylobacter sp. YRD-M1]
MNKPLLPILSYRWLLILGFPITYWLYSKSYGGPAYLADEIGYLSNAIFLAGYSVDGASSYHAGYSFLLSPLFRILPDSSSIWMGAMILNTLLWMTSFYFIDRLIVILRPNATQFNRILVVLFAGSYPAWITMAGYVFPTTAFVAFFLAGLVAFVSIKENNCKNIFLFTLLVGLLYWIHPTGLAVAAASIIVVSIWSIRTKSYSILFFHSIGVTVLVIAYKNGIHPWLADAMTPAGYRPQAHYPKLSQVFARVGEINYWTVLGTKAIGQISYLIVGSFGLAFFGFAKLVDHAKKLLLTEYPEPSNAAGTYAIVSLLGVIAIGVIGDPPSRIDHWIYGRYLDGVSMPVIAIGAMSLLEMKGHIRILLSILAFCIVVGTGFLVESQYIATQSNNLVNTPSFWPQYVFPQVDIAWWMIFGAITIVVVAIGGKYFALLAAFSSLVVSSANQSQWHLKILNRYSKPSSVVDFVRTNFPPGTCIGFDHKLLPELSTFQLERYGLYLFYFYDYSYRRTTADEWKANCDGPLLTYNPSQFVGSPSEYIIGKEVASALFFVVKNSKRLVSIPDNARSSDDVLYATSKNDHCLLAGCFSIKADKLTRFSKVGVIRDGQLLSTGEAGYLFYGPYSKLDKGSYYLIVRGDFLAGDTAVIDVISDHGRKVYYQKKLCHTGCLSREVRVPFELEEKVTDLEIRLHVSDIDQVSIDGYEIVIDDGHPFPRLPALQIFGSSLNVLPRTVGRIENIGIVSDRRSGYLVYGPYQPVAAGKYKLILRGKSEKSDSALVDVVSSKGTSLHEAFALKPTTHDSGVLAEGQIQLDAPVEDIEIRVYVGAEDDVTLEGYELVPVETEDHSVSLEHNPLN